jgi:outer membrane biogenesis lipoprotein LolB
VHDPSTQVVVNATLRHRRNLVHHRQWHVALARYRNNRVKCLVRAREGRMESYRFAGSCVRESCRAI